MQHNETPLRDTGNRTDLGSGGLRDINPENGRCDLLPASALCSYLRDSTLVTQSHNIEKPTLVNAFYYIMKFIDSRDTHYLTESIACLECWHNHKINVDNGNVSRDKTFAQSMLDLSIHYKNGALKYAERNWERGIPLHSFIDSAIRHLCKEILDWTDEPHDIAVMWNLYGAIWTLQHHPNLDDMPKYAERKENYDEVKKEDGSSGYIKEDFTEKEVGEEDYTEAFHGKEKTKPHQETCFG